MPGTDGYQICEQLKANESTRDIPVIFISGANQTIDKVKGFSKGAVDFVVKPYQAEEVLARIQTHVSLRNLRRNLDARVQERTADLTKANVRLLREIEARKQAEDALNQHHDRLEELVRERTAELSVANEQLKQLDRLKDEFVSTVTHELRTPLTSIGAIAEMLQRDPKMHLPQREKFLGIMIKESDRLTRLINEVLDLAKIESGNAEWHNTDLNLIEVIDDAILATQQMLEEKAVALTIEVPESVPLVTADHDRVIQVLLNLISNAAKFCDKRDGQITITLSHMANALRIDVKDNGPGVKLEDHELIFEKFRQVSDALVDTPRGTGLGLPISRKIVNHFGGRLWVENTPGQGATFSFTIPLANLGLAQK
jgi:signal transduction histidine kinase